MIPSVMVSSSLDGTIKLTGVQHSSTLEFRVHNNILVLHALKNSNLLHAFLAAMLVYICLFLSWFVVNFDNFRTR